jgi:hypothetical protein
MDAELNLIELDLIEQPFEVLSATDAYILMLYRVATYITFNVIDDAAMLAFGLS